MSVPLGFEPDPRSSPLLELLGPVHQRTDGPGKLTLGVRIDERHLNARGTAHGAVLTAMGDVALGRSAALLNDLPMGLVTVTLTTHFLRPVPAGSWLEVTATLMRPARSVVFAQGEGSIDGVAVAIFDAVFRKPRSA